MADSWWDEAFGKFKERVDELCKQQDPKFLHFLKSLTDKCAEIMKQGIFSDSAGTHQLMGPREIFDPPGILPTPAVGDSSGILPSPMKSVKESTNCKDQEPAMKFSSTVNSGEGMEIRVLTANNFDFEVPMLGKFLSESSPTLTAETVIPVASCAVGKGSSPIPAFKVLEIGLNFRVLRIIVAGMKGIYMCLVVDSCVRLYSDLNIEEVSLIVSVCLSKLLKRNLYGGFLGSTNKNMQLMYRKNCSLCILMFFPMCRELQFSIMLVSLVASASESCEDYGWLGFVNDSVGIDVRETFGMISRQSYYEPVFLDNLELVNKIGNDVDDRMIEFGCVAYVVTQRFSESSLASAVASSVERNVEVAQDGSFTLWYTTLTLFNDGGMRSGSELLTKLVSMLLLSRVPCQSNRLISLENMETNEPRFGMVRAYVKGKIRFSTIEEPLKMKNIIGYQNSWEGSAWPPILFYDILQQLEYDLVDCQALILAPKFNRHQSGATEVWCIVFSTGIFFFSSVGQLWSSLRTRMFSSRREIRRWKEDDNKVEMCQVGDVVAVEMNHYFPTDLQMLLASYDVGICYRETVRLDGSSSTVGILQKSRSSMINMGCSHFIKQQMLVILKGSPKRVNSLKLKRLIAFNHLEMGKFIDLLPANHLVMGLQSSLKCKTFSISICKETRLWSHLIIHVLRHLQVSVTILGLLQLERVKLKNCTSFQVWWSAKECQQKCSAFYFFVKTSTEQSDFYDVQFVCFPVLDC